MTQFNSHQGSILIVDDIPENLTVLTRILMEHSLFIQARNRITDVLERKPFTIVCQFFDQFFDFLKTLLSRQIEDTPRKLFLTCVRQKRLLLKGSQSSVRY